LEYESIAECAEFRNLEVERTWNNVDGIIRFEPQRNQYFIVARYPGARDLSVLSSCNLPQEFQKDKLEIKIFGNEFPNHSEPDSVITPSGSARIKVFEVTFVERRVR
jgi:hypothetical protein